MLYKFDRNSAQLSREMEQDKLSQIKIESTLQIGI